MDLSIIIVSWNAKRLLLECLQSLTYEHSAYSTEIIVVDNASTDGSPEAVQEQFPHVKLVRNDANLGFAKGNNIGIKQSIGEYICLVNSDVKVLKGCLDRMYDYMDRHPSVGILGPKILWPDLTLQDSCRKFPTLLNNLFPAIALDKAFPRSKIFSGEHMRYFPHDRVRTVDSLVGCFLMVRREAIYQVGLFDERFFIYVEEVDWCKRFWNSGWEVVFYPHAQVIHYGRGSSSNAPAKFAMEQERAKLQYWGKYHQFPSRFAILLIFALNHALRIAVEIPFLLIRSSKNASILYRINRHLACLVSLFAPGNSFPPRWKTKLIKER